MPVGNLTVEVPERAGAQCQVHNPVNRIRISHPSERSGSSGKKTGANWLAIELTANARIGPSWCGVSRGLRFRRYGHRCPQSPSRTWLHAADRYRGAGVLTGGGGVGRLDSHAHDGGSSQARTPRITESAGPAPQASVRVVQRDTEGVEPHRKGVVLTYQHDELNQLFVIQVARQSLPGLIGHRAGSQ